MPNIRTVADVSQIIASQLWRIDRNAYDVVIGIPRSGLIPASMISTFLQLPLATLEGFCAGIVHGRSGRPAEIGRRVLLVDDSCNKGGAMLRAVRMLMSFDNRLRLTRLAVFAPYQLERPEQHIDITLAECRGPRIFAWNMWKHKRMERWAYDMDGVLCRDPDKAENDDGERYRHWMATTEPLFVPLRPIGHIVTSRLEKYRYQTMDWLEKHGIKYRSLTMLDLPDKRARMTAMKVDGGRGGWKARQIARINSELLLPDEKPIEMMIESCPKQARIIARMARIPTFCTQTQEVFHAE